jgi:hypothetical protein
LLAMAQFSGCCRHNDVMGFAKLYPSYGLVSMDVVEKFRENDCMIYRCVSRRIEQRCLVISDCLTNLI